MSTTTTFDTLMYAKKLIEAGVPEKAAEVQAETLKDFFDNQLATKQDIEELKREIHDVKRDIKESADKLIIKFGSMLVIAVGVLVAIIKL